MSRTLFNHHAHAVSCCLMLSHAVSCRALILLAHPAHLPSLCCLPLRLLHHLLQFRIERSIIYRRFLRRSNGSNILHDRIVKLRGLLLIRTPALRERLQRVSLWPWNIWPKRKYRQRSDCVEEINTREVVVITIQHPNRLPVAVKPEALRAIWNRNLERSEYGWASKRKPVWTRTPNLSRKPCQVFFVDTLHLHTPASTYVLR